MTDALAGGAIDALFLVSASPVLALEDLARKTPIRIVPISGPIADKIVDVLPFYSVGVVPAGTYGMADDVQTLEVGILLVTRANLDDDLGFGITRAIWHERNIGLFQNGHPAGKLMSKEAAATGYNLPLHQGAARYYLGRGIPVPPQNLLAPVTPVRANSPNSRSS
jgi:TRAP transporter TAXI family solute receptor